MSEVDRLFLSRVDAAPLLDRYCTRQIMFMGKNAGGLYSPQRKLMNHEDDLENMLQRYKNVTCHPGKKKLPKL